MFVALAQKIWAANGHGGGARRPCPLAGRASAWALEPKSLTSRGHTGTGERNVQAQATGKPFDAVVEAVGRPEVWEAAVQRFVRKGGTVNFFGGCPGRRDGCRLDTALIHYSNLTLLASFHHTPRTVRRALAVDRSRDWSGRDDFVGGECPLTPAAGSCSRRWPRAITRGQNAGARA
jgi:hypothetical protein